MNTPPALLCLDNVTTYYAQMRILEGISLQVGQGELVCLLGGNASGKSTTLKTILGIVRPRAGRVLQLAGTLSGGEQQMVAMGRALMSRPRLLLMDEPSMGLSPALVQQNFQIIKDIHTSGVAVLIVEQNATMALSIADRGYVLSTGEIVLEGSAAELLASEDLRRAYLGR